MQKDLEYDMRSSVMFGSNLSEFDVSVNNQRQYELALNEKLANDSDDEDQDLKVYHQYLRDNFSQSAKSQAYSSYQDEYDGLNYEENDGHSTKSVKSRQSTGSFKTSRSASVKTIKTNNSKETDFSSGDFVKNKRKYLRQQARRIKSQLKNQQIRTKQEKRQFKDIEGIKDAPSRKYNMPNSKRKRLTKRTLQLLSKHFDQYYVAESNPQMLSRPKLTIKEIGSMFEIGPSSIHKLYLEWLNDPSFEKRIKRELLRVKSGGDNKKTLERLQHLNRLIKENPFMTQNQLTVELNKIDDLKICRNGKYIDITRTTVARLLKEGKFKKKRVKCVPKERNTTKSFEKRYEYCSKYKQIQQKGAKIYFLDESGFNLYMTRDKAWARPNEEVNVNCPITKGKRFSLIAIIAQDGLAHWRIIQGTYRKYEFLDFIRQMFFRIKDEQNQMTEEQRNDPENQKQKWLILDNCAIHDKEQTVNLARQCDVNILFLPPYSPQLNPIQNWFSEVKAVIRKINYEGEKQLLDIMHRTLVGYQDHDFSNYFHGILRHVDKGIRRERF